MLTAPASTVRSDGVVVWLHQVSHRWGLASPKTLGAASGTTAVMVEDVDMHHADAVEAGAEILYPPTDQPYGFREYSARDPEGGMWSFMKPPGLTVAKPLDHAHIRTTRAAPGYTLNSLARSSRGQIPCHSGADIP